MSNISAAREAILAELSHARKGVEFYQTRVQALEETLSQLESVDSTLNNVSILDKRRPAESTGAKKRGRKKAGEAAQGRGKDLPSTGREFWIGLLTEQPQSARELLQSAAQALDVSASDPRMKKLAQRQTTALHNLIKNNAIADIGSGRERKFLRK